VDVEQAEPGRSLSRDLSSRSPDAAEREIDSFIEHRSMKLKLEERDRAEEQAWAESTRRANEKRLQQARYEWHWHHTTQAERLRNTLELLIEHHEQRAEELMGSGGDAA
jgi:hypothetical protein